MYRSLEGGRHQPAWADLYNLGRLWSGGAEGIAAQDRQPEKDGAGNEMAERLSKEQCSFLLS